MSTYEQMLRGVQGLFAATGQMDRDNFHDYVSALNLDANFSGIQTIGVIEWVPGGEQGHSYCRDASVGFCPLHHRAAGLA